jgi:Protein of unknown function (DUF1579)
MTRSFAIAWAVVASFTLYLHSASGQAKPDDKKAAPAAAAAAPPAGPPKPGAETKALGFFIGTMSGAGKVEPGAFGPGSPATTSKSKHTCKWAVDNLWVQCDISDTAGSGKDAQTWVGHMLIGWDFEAKGYRAVGVDNMGTAFDLVGKMDGKKLVLESPREVMMMGTPIKFRISYDSSDPKALKFTDERSAKGAPFQLAETVSFKKSGG